jgi:nucleotide-binding universal stress UspA family protein
MLPYRTILHATDFSACSRAAFRLACALARDFGARLIVLHVQPPPVATVETGYLILPVDATRDELMQQLRGLRPDDPSVAVEYRLAEGEPAATILRVALDTRSDLVVLGTHGRHGLPRLLLGSVAEDVLRRAQCPVVTIKEPPHESKDGDESAHAATGAARAKP